MAPGSSDKKHNLSLRLVLFFRLPLLFCRLSTVSFIDSKTRETIPLQFPRCFQFFFFTRKTLRGNFSRWMSANCAASANKRRKFWRETHTPLWPLIGRIIFLISEKTSFAILIGRIIYFMCESHRSLFWLARIHLRMKSYDIAFRWVFLSMYITGEGKRQNEFAEWHVAWLAEWHNYAECKIWKMAQRYKCM